MPAKAAAGDKGPSAGWIAEWKWLAGGLLLAFIPYEKLRNWFFPVFPDGKSPAVSQAGSAAAVLLALGRRRK